MFWLQERENGSAKEKEDHRDFGLDLEERSYGGKISSIVLLMKIRKKVSELPREHLLNFVKN